MLVRLACVIAHFEANIPPITLSLIGKPHDDAIGRIEFALAVYLLGFRKIHPHQPSIWNKITDCRSA